MALGLLQTVISVVSTCSKRVSRAAKKKLQAAELSSRRSDNAGADGGNSKRRLIQWKRRDGGHKGRHVEEEMEEEEVMGMDDDEGVWRRAILLGEKCQPPDFSGVIYYDADGRRLSEFPTTPRSPMRSPLPSFAGKFPIVIKEDKDGSY